MNWVQVFTHLEIGCRPSSTGHDTEATVAAFVLDDKLCDLATPHQAVTNVQHRRHCKHRNIF